MQGNQTKHTWMIVMPRPVLYYINHSFAVERGLGSETQIHAINDLDDKANFSKCPEAQTSCVSIVRENH